MKSIILLMITLGGVVLTGRAQSANPGSILWVVETNVHQKNFAIVRIYNQDELVQTINLNRYIDLRKRKDKKRVQQIVENYTGKAWASKRNKDKRPIWMSGQATFIRLIPF